MTIKSIAAQIVHLSEKLEKGELRAEEIEQMTEFSRQLYERLVVLQYKSYEATVKAQDSHQKEQEAEASANEATEPGQAYEPEAPAAEPIPAPEPVVEERKLEQSEPKPEPETEPQPDPEPEPKRESEQKIEEDSEDLSDRIAFRFEPDEIPSNQISLIDSIEEIKKMERSINEAFSDQPASLSQRLNRKPVANLKTAITINQRFKFISELFDNDADAFAKAIDRLNSCTSYIEADEFIQNGLTSRFEWEMKSPTVREMMDLVERRFL